MPGETTSSTEVWMKRTFELHIPAWASDSRVSTHETAEEAFQARDRYVRDYDPEREVVVREVVYLRLGDWTGHFQRNLHQEE